MPALFIYRVSLEGHIHDNDTIKHQVATSMTSQMDTQQTQTRTVHHDEREAHQFSAALSPP